MCFNEPDCKRECRECEELHARIAALEAELLRVRTAKAEELAASASFLKMEYKGLDGVEFQVASPLAKTMVQWALADFESAGGINFVERSIEVGGWDGPRFVLTIQKQDGKSPGQIVGEQRNQIAALEARCKVLGGFVEESRELLACVDKLGIRKLVAGWHGENNPRGPYPPHPKNLGVKLDTTAGLVVLMDRAAEALRKHDAATTDAAKALEAP